MTRRYLIVNADDFGLSAGVNKGVIRAHEIGIVTSASLMIRWPAAGEAAAYARAHPSLSVGLHVDLGEWARRDGRWRPVYRVLARLDRPRVDAEARRQLALFQRLVGKDPTHIDSHQHVHRDEPAASIFGALAARIGVPLRERSRVRYCGDFYGQNAEGDAFPEVLTVESLRELLARLPAGVTELGCHPGLDDDVDSMYRAERATEVSVLCDPRTRAAIREERIDLISFHELPASHRRMASGVTRGPRPVPDTLSRRTS